MAESESPNQPKAVVEPVPEEIEKSEKDKVVTEEIKKLDKEDPVEQTYKKMTRMERRELQEKQKRQEALENWIPVTELGKLVKTGKEKDIDKILDKHKRRAWRQTQKKTKEGNVLTFSSMAVVGDMKGHVGIGFGKAKETLPSKDKALRQAKINLTRITLGFESPKERSKPEEEPHTVPFKVEGKAGSVKITILPAARGTGLVAGDETKKILRIAGIKDAYTITKGQTKTAFNLTKAILNALEKTNKEILT
jgi:small subunit ribosomal protein S5